MGLQRWLVRRIGWGIAKVQLRSFQMFRKTYPDKSNDEIFRLMLEQRPGWSADRIDGLMSEEGRDGSLLNFIERIIRHEYTHKLSLEDLARAQLGARDYLKKEKQLLYAKREGVLLTEVNPEVFVAPIRQLYTSLAEIASNVEYISSALPSVTIPETERQQIGKDCVEFGGTIYDVRTEIRNLEDKLGLHPGEPPNDPDIVNPDPRVTMEMIDQWLRKDVETMGRRASHLIHASETAPDAYDCLLVGESTANILNAYLAIQKTLSMINAKLKQTRPNKQLA